TYRINIDTDALISECVIALQKADFPEPVIVLTKGRFVIAQFTIRLSSKNGNTARLFLEVKDTDGLTKTYEELPVSIRTDLAKHFNEPRLRKFKVLDIGGDGDDAYVKFENGEIVTRYREITFTSEHGQKPDAEIVKQINHTYPVFDFIGRAAKQTNLTRRT